MKNTKKIAIALLIMFSISFLGLTMKDATVSAAPSGSPVYRVYNPNNGEHLHTMSAGEKDYLSSVGWKYEGISMYMPNTGKPLYRLYNPNSGEHFYTLSTNEKSFLAKNGWKYEGVAWYTPETGLPLYRLYNPNELKAGAHHYTTLLAEKEMLVKSGWKYEGVSWYSLASTPSTSTTTPTESTSTPVSNRIVEEAKKQLGVPYLAGGSTPAGFDCSGLTQYVYKKATGKNIGRVTTNQEYAGTKIPVSKAKPGDLLFWGVKGSTYHVAIYIGQGKYIHAPVAGEKVKVQSISLYTPSFAVRVN